MINFDDYTNENKTEHNSKQPYIRDHPQRILIIRGSGGLYLFGIFMITSFGTFKYDCVIKTADMFNLLPLINSSVTIEFSFLIINHISNHIIKTINILRVLLKLYFSIFL